MSRTCLERGDSHFEEGRTSLSRHLVAAAKEAAKQTGKLGDDEYVITLSRSLAEPFLTFSDRRDLRQKVWEKWTKRGELDPVNRNNKQLAEDILKLRQKQAQMHQKTSFGEYQCEDMMAKTPERVMELLESVWGKACISANKEREALLEYCNNQGDQEKVENIEPGLASLCRKGASREVQL